MQTGAIHQYGSSDQLQHFLRCLRNFHLRIFFVFLLLRLFRLKEIKPEQLSNHIVGSFFLISFTRSSLLFWDEQLAILCASNSRLVYGECTIDQLSTTDKTQTSEL